MEVIGVIGLIVLYKLLDQPQATTDIYIVHNELED